MRHLSSLLTVVVVLIPLAGCPSTSPVECRDQASCDLGPGGVCVAAPTGNQWCAYPDLSCPGGVRYSDDRVGDGLAGTCVDGSDPDASEIDGPIDAAIDGIPIDGNGVIDPVMHTHGTAAGVDTGTAIAPTTTGFYLAGDIAGPTDFGGGLRSGSKFVAGFDFDGGHIWSRGVDVNNGNIDVIADGSNNAVLGGDFMTAFTLGTTADTLAPVNRDGFVAKLAGSNGSHVWSKRIGGDGIDLVNAVGVFAGGDILVVGRFIGTINLGGLPLSSTGTTYNAFVARLGSTSGAHIWSTAITGTDYVSADEVLVDPLGNVVLAGAFRGTLTVNGTDHTAAGMTDGFVAKLNGSTSQRMWSVSYGGSGVDAISELALASDGGLLVGGSFNAAFTFGTALLSPTGSYDAVVAKLDSTTGTATWATAFGGRFRESVRGLADVGGQVIVGAQFSDSMMFGTQPLAARGQDDVLVGRLTLSTGAPAGAVRYGSAANETLGDLKGAGSLFLLTGSYQGQSVDFGIVTLTSSGDGTNSDIFAGMLLP